MNLKEKIKFRALAPRDVEDLFEIYSDKEAMKFRGSQPMKTLDDAKKYVADKKVLQGKTLTIRMAVECVQSKKIIGSVMYRFDVNNQSECQIGYSIGRKFWGQGFGNEMVHILLQTLKEKKTVKEVIAWTNKANVASIKILEKNKFLQVAQNEHPERYLYRRKL